MTSPRRPLPTFTEWDDDPDRPAEDAPRDVDLSYDPDELPERPFIDGPIEGQRTRLDGPYITSKVSGRPPMVHYYERQGEAFVYTGSYPLGPAV